MNSCCSEEQLAVNIKELLIEHPEIVGALSISSKQVGIITSCWIEGTMPLERRHLYTIYKYIARMATRSTPFGLSAGIALGDISNDKTDLRIVTRSKIHSRLSASFLSSQFAGTALAKNFKDQELILNSTLFKLNGFFRYARKLDENSTDHKRIKIKNNPLLELVYQKVQDGTTFLNLEKYLTQKGLSEQESANYIIKLLDCEFLTSILNPSFSGDKYRKLIADLPLKGLLGNLARNIHNRIDNDYMELFKYWENLSVKSQRDLLPELEINKQIEVEKLNINEKMIKRITSELMELLPYLETADLPELEIFKRKFSEKYDLQEIPLLEVMDSDISLGYGDKTQQYQFTNPLIKSLNIKKKGPAPGNNLYNLVNRALAEAKKIELELPTSTKRDLSEEHLPPTSALHGILYNGRSFNAEPNDFSFLLKSWNGPTSNQLLSRFAYMSDTLHEKLIESSKFDQNVFEDYILAEIVYSPPGKEANILQRPDLYPYEIPVLGNSSKSKDYQIPLNDIYVSVKNNKVLLRSMKHNKYIIPRLTSAHNYRKANPIYRFLADLQFQFSKYHFQWNWDTSSKRTYYPRITYKHLILSRACWYIELDGLEQYSRENLPLLIKKLKIDETVVIAEGDNELYIDLKTSWGKEILRRKINKGAVILFEILEEENYALCDTNNQKYVHEITIPLAMNISKPVPILPEKQELSVTRSFSPGSEWTYLKIYSSPTDADGILINIIYPIILQMQNQKKLGICFFVRYNDPDFHIRLRFSHPENCLQNFQNIAALFTNKINSGHFGVKKLQYDTYEREIERYGNNTIETIEKIFWIDSQFILRIFGYPQSADENLRWKIAIIGVNLIFNSFYVQIEDRINYLNNWSNALRSEFSLSKEQVNQIHTDYRKIKNTIDSVLKNQDIDILFVQDIINQMELELEILLKKLTVDQTSSIIKRLGSILHMFMNRLFSTDQKLNELVIYIYLYHYYRSVKAFKRN